MNKYIKTEIIKDVFSKRLRLLMEEHKETTYSLAEKFGLSSASISRYMTGKMTPKVTTVNAFATHFNVNVIWLMGYDVPQKEKVQNNGFTNSEVATLIKQVTTDDRLKELIKNYLSTDTLGKDALLSMSNALKKE